MRENQYGKTADIPAKVVNGTFQYLYGGDLPELNEGTIFKLVVPEYGVVNKDFFKKLAASDFKEILSKDSLVFAAVSSRQIPEDFKRSAFRLEEIIHGDADQSITSANPDSLFVEIRIEEPLFIQLRGTKPGRLGAVKCYIPSLKLKAISLNHAYRLISDVFEPHRISHSGNVFQKIVSIDSHKHCCLLYDLRSKLEAENEPSLL